MAAEALFGPLPSNWEVTTVGDACSRGGGDVQTGPFGSQLHASDYVLEGVPSVMPQNIGDNRVVVDGISRIRPEDVARLNRYRVTVGDIVYSRRGDVERRALIREEEDGWLCGTGCLRVRFGQGYIDPSYGSYYLGHPEVRQWIVRHAVGATMPNLNTSILSGLPIARPPLPEQRAIAHILGTLDDKIELNRRMNATLEALPRALFQSWFVDFDPVRARAEGRQPEGMDAATAALFPDDFEETELGEIPRGWKIAPLGDIACQLRKGAQPETLPAGTPYIGLEHMPRKSLALSDWGNSDEIVSQKSWFSKGDILFGKLRPYFHKVGITPVDGVCSTDIVVLNAREPEWLGQVVSIVSSDAFVAFVTASSDGTKMPRTRWDDMARYPVMLPPASLAALYTSRTQPLLNLITCNIWQSRALIALRDALLPKLLSGEIRVGEAERAVEGAG